MTLDDYTCFYFIDKPEYNVEYEVLSDYICVGICSNFEECPPNQVMIGETSLTPELGICTPDLHGRVELFCGKSPFGIHNLKIKGSEKFSALISIFGFSDTNKNPIKDFKLQTGSTHQFPDIYVNSNKRDHIISLYTDDSDASSKYILDCYDEVSYKLPRGLSGSYLTNGDKRSSVSFDKSSSWAFLGVVIQPEFFEEIPKPQFLSLNSQVQLLC